MDTATFLGAHGGQLAVAFGSGCVAGYGFCMRTIYKLLDSKAEREHQECLSRIVKLEEEKRDLVTRLEIIEDRTFNGQERQLAQIRQSALQIIDGRAVERKDE